MTETVTLQTPVTAKNDMPSLDLVLILQQMAATIDAQAALIAAQILIIVDHEARLVVLEP